MNEPMEERYETWDRFLLQFPLKQLEDMTLDEYTRVGSKESFTWWIEVGLNQLGSIGGGASSFKFGIYARKNTEKEFKAKQYKGDDQFAWLSKYGDTAGEAFSTVKGLIVQVAKAVQRGDIKEIVRIDLGPAYKWKIAFHYQDRENPIVLNIFKKNILAHFLQAKAVMLPETPTFPFLYHEVLKLRGNQDLLEFADIVWREGTVNQAYDTLKADFLSNFPGFISFVNPSEGYLTEERNYKQELCSIFADEIAPRLHPLPEGEAELTQLGKDISSLLFRKLTSIKQPQNLVGWRYSSLADELVKKGMAHLFARAVSRLTDTGIDLEERIPEFVAFLHKHSADGKCSPAATRSLTTFFLFLSDPNSHFFVKTQEVNRLLKLFSLDAFNNDSISSKEYSRVLNLAGMIRDLLIQDGLEPRDMIDVQSFVWSALQPQKEENDNSNADAVQTETKEPVQDMTLMTIHPLNQILYGPPGTGKTYRTATLAVRICDGMAPDDRTELMERYRELIAEKRINFVSFHQSFSYEEFIEGIRPELAGHDESEQEQLIYKVEDGLFKKICSMARTAVDDLKRPKGMVDNLEGRSFFKMSVGGKYDPDVESFCFDNDYLALGYGGDVDFSGLPKEKLWEPASTSIKELMVEEGSEHAEKRFAVQAMFTFKEWIDVGDIVIVPKGISQVQAIGQVTGEYEYRPELLPGHGYVHFRKVKWLVRDAAIPTEKVLSKNFSMQSIYSLNPAILNMEYLKKILSSDPVEEQLEGVERYVLIIDEINRANISKVLGELITLMETDKRLGAENEVTVKLPYSREEFGIPANLHIVGTMNTADRSLALMDTALRRRFDFMEMMPDYRVLHGVMVGDIDIEKLLRTMNQRIEALYDREHTVGHAFFISLIKEPSIDNLASIFKNKIIPLLAEYFFEDWQKIRLVLGDNQKTERPEAQFILEDELEGNGSALFGNSSDLSLYGLDRARQFRRNDKALNDMDAYIGIYDSDVLQGE